MLRTLPKSIYTFCLLLASWLLISCGGGSGSVNTLPKKIDIRTTTKTALVIIDREMTPILFQNKGEAITRCQVSPPLPAGLQINTTSCAITGTPSTVNKMTLYAITASNNNDTSNVFISIEVKLPDPQAPKNLKAQMGDGNIRLTWQASRYYRRYVVYYSTKSFAIAHPDNINLHPPPYHSTEVTTAKTSIAVKFDLSYYFRVATKGERQKMSAFSNEANSTLVRFTPLRVNNSYVNVVAFSPDSKILASGHMDKTIRLWSTTSHQNFRTLSGHTDHVNSLAFSPDSRILASGSRDNTILLWNTISYKSIKTLSGHTDQVNSLAFSPDGKILASSGADTDKTIRLWSTASYQSIKTLRGHTAYVRAVAFSPDGKILASASGDKTIRLWSTNSYQNISTLTGHTKGVDSVAFSPDGKILASGSWDNTIRLWSTISYESIKTLSGQNYVSAVAFSPDGKILASGGWDHMIRLWSTTSYQNFRTLNMLTTMASIAFRPDGKAVAGGGWDKLGLWWDVLSP